MVVETRPSSSGTRAESTRPGHHRGMNYNNFEEDTIMASPVHPHHRSFTTNSGTNNNSSTVGKNEALWRSKQGLSTMSLPSSSAETPSPCSKATIAALKASLLSPDGTIPLEDSSESECEVVEEIVVLDEEDNEEDATDEYSVSPKSLLLKSSHGRVTLRGGHEGHDSNGSQQSIPYADPIYEEEIVVDENGDEIIYEEYEEEEEDVTEVTVEEVIEEEEEEDIQTYCRRRLQEFAAQANDSKASWQELSVAEESVGDLSSYQDSKWKLDNSRLLSTEEEGDDESVTNAPESLDFLPDEAVLTAPPVENEEKSQPQQNDEQISKEEDEDDEDQPSAEDVAEAIEYILRQEKPVDRGFLSPEQAAAITELPFRSMKAIMEHFEECDNTGTSICWEIIAHIVTPPDLYAEDEGSDGDDEEPKEEEHNASGARCLPCHGDERSSASDQEYHTRRDAQSVDSGLGYSLEPEATSNCSSSFSDLDQDEVTIEEADTTNAARNPLRRTPSDVV